MLSIGSNSIDVSFWLLSIYTFYVFMVNKIYII
jgi:hypothetical protein